MCRRLIYLISFVLVLGLASHASAALVAHWKFNNDATDSVGNLNWTLNGGATYSTDAVEGSHSLSLDGVDDYAGQTATGALNVAFSTKTVTMWFKANMTSGTQVLFDEGGTTRGLCIRINNGNLETAVREASTQVTFSTSFSSTNWTHVAVTFNNGQFTLYVNGVEKGSVTAGFTTATAHGNAPGIGARNAQDSFGGTATGGYFGGLIDDVQLYDNALLATEIKELYKVYGITETPYGPNPADKAADVLRDVVLSWTPGVFADKHDVYFGTNFNDVNDADRTNPLGVLASQNQDANTYDPVGVLDFGQTYYWRVDEVNAPPDFTIFRGGVWQFTVEPFAYPIAGENITATASSQFNPNTKPEITINGSGLDDNDLHSTEEAGIWLSSMTGAQPTWIQYEFDRVYKLHQMWVWNYNTSIDPVLGFGVKDATIEYSIDGVNWTTLGTTHEFARASGAAGYAHNTTVDLSDVVAKYVKITANSNWGGIMPQYGLSEVRFLYIPVWAREPNPASGSTDINVDNVTLSWRAGREAAKHNLYLSTDQQAVIDETISPVSIPADSSYAKYNTGPLELGKSYYWKVNEVNEAETPAIWQGDVLNFSTQAYLVVDGFEDYNDFEPDRIFDTWIDGWGVPTNGSQVGYAVPPFAERTIVHGGKQSMPLNYDNSTTASYSEATANVANLQVGQDWTKYGIRTLSLWFYGDPNNAVTEKMYVKLNGSKVIYDGEADNITRIGWQPWNIELSSFGVNLRNVTELKIGFERSGAVGGKGVVYFDDIRLYPYSRQLITPAEPSQAGLVGHWQFEGNLSDSSGNGRNGTGVGNPTFAAGKIGQAINLRGVNDYVEITGYKGILGPNAVTVTAWIRMTSTQTGAIIGWGPNVDGQRFELRIDANRLRTEHHGGNVQGNSPVNNGGWHHVAVTVQANATISYPEVILWLNGIDDTRPSTDPDAFNLTAGLDVSIGRRPASNDRFFMGQIDDVRIYDRALTQEEVAWLAGRTKPFDKPF